MSPSRRQVEELVQRAAAGERVGLARLLSYVERGGDVARIVEAVVHPLGGRAQVVGITGSPGSGKSTLTNSLCTRVRDHGRIGVLCIDPSSPFTGGAILGDRVRMGDQTLERDVFIRSMATRGHLGGLSLATPAAIRVLDAAGFETVIVETVGVGQVEVEIVGAADTTVVVLNPGWGDAIQANKAGLMEIADVFVVNKADRPGAADTERDVQSVLALREPDGWIPPIVSTVATDGTGVGELERAIEDHRRWLADSGEGERRARRRVADEVAAIVGATLVARARTRASGTVFDALCDDVIARRLDPWSAADRLISEPHDLTTQEADDG